MAKATYQAAGVDLKLYEQAMARLPRLLHRTYSPRVIPLDGGFAGLFQLDFTNQLFARKYVDPVLVACTDGVGTKLKVAVDAEKHDTVGIDLVAMCVNDALCCGAEPLFFLDYVAMSRDDPPMLEQIVRGVTDGCLQSDCALLGGETAILPGMYQPGEYDLAGFCVGVVERRRIIDGRGIADGDLLIGVGSSGLHSNGYSLVRRIVFEIAGMHLGEYVEPLGRTVAEELLQPTRIYVQAVRRVLARYRVKAVVHGIAHITGGGLHENLARILPEGASAVIDRDSWPVPPVFPWLMQIGDVEPEEMQRVFNMGIGLVMVVSPFYADSIRSQLADNGYVSWPIGRIEPGDRGVVWSG
jgi:phosphoribosylformylglycinamidine cyclo-ligase